MKLFRRIATSFVVFALVAALVSCGGEPVAFTDLPIPPEARPLESGLLTGSGSVLTIGRRTATADARITDGNDRLVAQAVATCLVMPRAT